MSDPFDCAIESWFLSGKNPGGYESRPGWLKSKQPKTPEFGTIMRQLRTDAAPASAWLGKRLRFRAEVKTADVREWAGLWMRVDGEKVEGAPPRMLAFDNMQARALVGSLDWAPRDVVLDVPADAKMVAFGLTLVGDGESWIRAATLEPVGAEVPATAIRRTTATITDWIREESLEPFLTALGWIVEYDFGPEDWSAVSMGVRDTDVEADRWYDYPLRDSTRVAIARDPEAGLVFLRIDVRDWQRREVELALKIFGHFVVTDPRAGRSG